MALFFVLTIPLQQILVKRGINVKQSFVSSDQRFLSFISALFLFSGISSCTLIPETDPDRGATTVQQDTFGDSYTTVKYLDQGWDISDSLWLRLIS